MILANTRLTIIQSFFTLKSYLPISPSCRTVQRVEQVELQGVLGTRRMRFLPFTWANQVTGVPRSTCSQKQVFCKGPFIYYVCNEGESRVFDFGDFSYGCIWQKRGFQKFIIKSSTLAYLQLCSNTQSSNCILIHYPNMTVKEMLASKYDV